MEQFGDRSTAEKAAAGWGGGRYALLKQGDHAAVALSTTWDTARDAREYFQAYGDALRTRFGQSGQVRVAEPDRLLAMPPLAAPKPAEKDPAPAEGPGATSGPSGPAA